MSQEFFNRMAPAAQRAMAATGIPASVILAQWAIESGYGSSELATKANNFGGITYYGQASGYYWMSGRQWGFYPAGIDQFADDYIQVMSHSRYAAVRSAGTMDGAINALIESPYDAGHYHNNPSQFYNIISGYGLSVYDGGGKVKSDLTSELNTALGSLKNWGTDDLQKWAGVGLAFAALVAFVRS